MPAGAGPIDLFEGGISRGSSAIFLSLRFFLYFVKVFKSLLMQARSKSESHLLLLF